MNDSFKNIIESAREILFLLPQNANFDAVAGGLSFYLVLQGKVAYISSPTPPTVEYNRLVGVNKIKNELGGKNLTIRLVDYPAKNIEKVSYDIVNDEFRLMVVPKDSTTPPGGDQVHLSYSGVSADLVILVGGTTEADFPALSSDELGKAKIVHIGIKQLNTTKDFGILSFARPASSLSELVTSLVKEIGYQIDADMATNLLAGIKKATNNLTSDEVNADTFEVVASLMRNGAKKELEMPKPKFPFPGGMQGMPGGFPPMPMPQRPNPVLQQNTPTEVEAKDNISAPKDWLQPKIFTGNKGTSVS